MDGIADMGGTDGWGRVPQPIPGEPAFPEPWHGRAFALSLLASRVAGGNLDAWRHALERLGRNAYLDDGYFGRWLNAAELVLVESGILAPTAIRARARRLRGDTDGDIADPPPPEPNKPDYAMSAPGQLRTVDRPAALSPGTRVRTASTPSTGHTRLPRYLRGHQGVITAIQPAQVFADTNAHFAGENPQYVYTVRFASRDLWGPQAESFSVSADLYESYLSEVP